MWHICGDIKICPNPFFLMQISGTILSVNSSCVAGAKVEFNEMTPEFIGKMVYSSITY